MARELSGGLVHELRSDLIKALTETREIADRWENLSPIGRNEFICWVEDAKQEKTRARRIRRAVEELLEGQNGQALPLPFAHGGKGDLEVA